MVNTFNPARARYVQILLGKSAYLCMRVELCGCYAWAVGIDNNLPLCSTSILLLISLEVLGNYWNNYVVLCIRYPLVAFGAIRTKVRVKAQSTCGWGLGGVFVPACGRALICYWFMWTPQLFAILNYSINYSLTFIFFLQEILSDQKKWTYAGKSHRFANILWFRSERDLCSCEVT